MMAQVFHGPNDYYNYVGVKKYHDGYRLQTGMMRVVPASPTEEEVDRAEVECLNWINIKLYPPTPA